MALQFGRSRLPELLRARNMSQAELARRIGVSRSYISQIISGKETFSLIKAKEAAIVLECYVDDLYEWVW
ncbi:XRE family transcriptional regulator [Paenibacillus naphthalenovorans]|uniref:helix-turn-helix transcriptional regulator n=1 Tax=Paenibacillus naphthalenovorans TaxID=162209 RepID=UPI0010B98CA1|nr:helix-turn-helix transcriptional regulator [Paenibacillus naphthalenovorans]GCL71750.1 XRE family transcriptional regulator [Paenibacillus naphthalenovorans]